jgi:16S rRNA (cytidine1402-2'-O)-methyltransferase
MLYIVATPIGNLQDITYRAVEVLRTVDMIACEDTRHTKILLDHYGITTRTTSFFQHNRFIKGEYLMNLLKEGKNIALVSDAGMPGVLDPGYNLINMAIQAEIPMTVIPGATALINGLVLSGKPAHQFYFEGFLPPKPGARRNRLTELLRLDCTIVFYESCHRIRATLETLSEIAPERQIVVTRELTKKIEEAIRGTPSETLEKLLRNPIRGEFAVIL